MSQLLCEQVVGRGLRRASYDLGEDEKFTEEVAKVFGVPFDVIPFKANPDGGGKQREKRWHVHALSERSAFEIRFPRVEGYIPKLSATASSSIGKMSPLFLWSRIGYPRKFG